MRRRGLLLVFSICLVHAENVSLPGVPDISLQVSRLVSEEFENRNQAKEQLVRWSEQFPRYMLTCLAEEYRKREDLEIVHQLEALLRELGEQTLFYQPKAFLGVNFELFLLPDGREVIHLQNVIKDAPADVAGLRSGDYILEVGGVKVSSYEDVSDFASQIQKQLPLEGLSLRILRKEKEFMVEVILTVKKTDASLVNDRLGEEERKVEEWLVWLRPGDKAISPDRPVGTFKMD